MVQIHPLLPIYGQMPVAVTHRSAFAFSRFIHLAANLARFLGISLANGSESLRSSLPSQSRPQAVHMMFDTCRNTQPSHSRVLVPDGRIGLPRLRYGARDRCERPRALPLPGSLP